jgi:hypothetical protein
LAADAQICEKIPERAKAFYAETQRREARQENKQMLIANLCALASLREIVYFFTAWFVLMVTPSSPQPAKRGAPSALRRKR